MVVREPTSLYVEKRSTLMMKFKPKKSDTYLITDYHEEISKDGVPKGRLGAVSCIPLGGGDVFRVGSGFTSLQREELWERRVELRGALITVGYQHTTARGVPRFPIVLIIQKPERRQ
jgi:ATP-dependent DNA ligase